MSNGLIITLSCMIGAILIIVAIIAALRIHSHRKHIQVVQQRDNDQVHYAFIVNPSKPNAQKIVDRIREYCVQQNITETTFIETQLDKDGRQCAFEALHQGADVVIAVGGDGTVRTVASALAGSGHAMGIIPIGTGNLFARNMNIPVDDLDAAIGIATSHGSRKVDLGRLYLLDKPEEDHGHAFLIIAGLGFDAIMIDDTDPTLKKNISWLAYFVSGAKHLFTPKITGQVSITRANGTTRTFTDLQFRTFMAGNCGQIPVFSLMPQASFSDGLLDFEVIDTTGGLIGWANLFGDVVHQTITKRVERRPLSHNSTIDQFQGPSAEIRLEKPVLAQVDGDMLPQTCHLRFCVEQEALIVRAPDEPANTSSHASASAVM